MAQTSISDVIEPETWNPYVINRTTELSELITSGIIVPDAEFDAKADSGGSTVDMPYWNDLTGDDEVLTEAGLTPGKLTTGQDAAIVMQRGKAWQHTDLAGILAGSDPARAAGDLVASFWARSFQKTTLSQLKGIFATAGMAGLLHAIHAASGALGAANYLTGATFVDACQRMGDAKGMLSAVIMHSAVEASLVKADLIDYIPESEGKPAIKTFQGKRVIVDDTMPVQVINSANVYTTYIFGRGAIAFGDGRATAAAAVQGGIGTWGNEFYRNALLGSSGMANRKRMILHVRGVKWLGAVMAGSSPTNAELENAANWNRVWDIKKLRVVRITHNIAA